MQNVACARLDSIFKSELLFDYLHFIKNVPNNWITASWRKLDFHADGKR